MRSDLSANFIAAMSASGRRPRLLSVWHFEDEDVYLSDQTLGAADGLEHEYQALVEDWGEIRDVGDPQDPYSSDIRQCTITLWNGGESPFSDRFLSQDPENVPVDVYQWFVGLADAQKALIDRFVCQDPIDSTEASRLLRVDLVSLTMRYDGPVGDVIKLADWANCKEENIGKYIPVVLGDPGYVPTICVKSAPKCTLDGSILDDTLLVDANEDLDEEGFTQTGTLQIGAERMTYSSRTASRFFISQRGADGTTAAEHLNQEEVQQHIVDFTYLIGQGPISGVNAVKVDGIACPVSIYTVYPALNPARIVFSEKPYALDYARGSSFLEMQFDAVASGNTALYPHRAYDPASVTSAAEISEDNPLLALRQVTVNPDRGEIVRAYVAVEWAASRNALQHDRARVSIVGVGDLGYLERPSEYDDLALDAEVDIDHGHGHSISGEHSHPLSDAVYGTSETPHGHASVNLSQQIRIHAPSQVSLPLNGSAKSVTLSNCYASYSSATLHFLTSPEYGCSFNVQGGTYRRGGVGNSFFAIQPSGEDVTIYFKWDRDPMSMTMNVFDIWIDYVINSAVQNAYTGVSVSKAADGSMSRESDKAATDVDDLFTTNRGLSVNDTGMMTKTVVELFDITEYVALDWDWFTGKEVRVQYDGTVDNQTLYLYHVFFDIEFRRVERIFSDDVTCEPVGLIDDAGGTYTGTPSAQITRPDHVRKYLLANRGGLPVANIDAVSFAAAGARYTAEDYTFNGMLDGALTVRETEKKLARECRSRWFWDGGKAMIKFREFQADWTIDKTISQSSGALRLKGLGMERKRVQNIINRVHLYYYRDWTGTAGGVDAYLSMAASQNNESIARHGIREQPERFMFDLVRDAAMATDLADFYKEDGAPSSFYTLECFLPYFDLQKEDHIRLTHDFTGLQKAAMRIAGIERVLGSGKVRRMNLLRIIAESWYRLMSVRKQDTVKVSDLLHITFQFDDTIIDGVGVSDLLRVGFNFSDTVSVTEALAIVVAWAVSQTETVTCTDSLAAHMGVAVSDTVTVREFLDAQIGSGFGMGSFGDSLFGSQSMMDHNPDDFVACLDELTALLNAVLADTVTCTDELLFSSGFGSPWSEGEGFGEEPLGS